MVLTALKDYQNNGLWGIKLLRKGILLCQSYPKWYQTWFYMRAGLKILSLFGKKTTKDIYRL